MAKKAEITDIFTTYLVNQDINQINKQLIESIKSKKLDQVKSLIEVGADINFKDEQNVTALMHAAYIGSTDIVKILIEAGANILEKDINDETALVYAAKAGKALIIDILTFARKG